MTEKYWVSSSKNKQKRSTFTNQDGGFDNQFRNLNLNQNNQKCFNSTVGFSNYNNEKQNGNYYNEYNRKKNYEAVDRRIKNQCKNYSTSKKSANPFWKYPPTIEADQNHKMKENDQSNNSKSSTLSLNIQKYESSIENPQTVEMVKDNNNDYKTKVESFSEIQDKDSDVPIPRQQQQNEDFKPEDMKFSANKKLFNPNEAKTSSSSILQKTAKIVSIDQDPSWDLEFTNYNFKHDKGQKFWIPRNNMRRFIIDFKNDKMNEMIEKTAYLSSGTFGSVTLCKIQGLKQEFAVKTFKNVQSTIGIIAELIVYSNITNSPNIPKLLYAGINKNNFYSIVTEYISGGTLDKHISRIPIDSISFIALEIARGLQCLHGIELTHGDLKPNNIAFTPDGHVKLIDFGSSRVFTKPTILPGTFYPYQAPEITKGLPAGASSDWWSYGCILVHFHQKVIPFDIQKPIEGNPVADDFIKKLLIENPDDRLRNVFDHEYLQAVDPKPKYIPGVYELKDHEQPIHENIDRKKCFELEPELVSEIFMYELHRFPTEKWFKSFK